MEQYKKIFKESIGWDKVFKILKDDFGIEDSKDDYFFDYNVTPSQVESFFKKIKNGSIMKGGSPEAIAFYVDGDGDYYFFSDGMLEYKGDDENNFLAFILLFLGDNGDPNTYMLKG